MADAGENRRYVYIEAMWHDGFTTPEIADELGTTPGTIENAIHRMRAAGWDVPYRYEMRDGRRAGGLRCATS